MRRVHLFHLLIAAVVVCVSTFIFIKPTFANDLTPQTEAAIKAENARWAEAYARGDYEAIGRLYTKNGTLLPPGGNRIVGASEIVNFFTKASSETQPDTVSFSNYEFYGNDQVVTEVSDTDIRDPSGKLKYRGKQILIFLKQGETWKLHRDIWNESAP
ncbi:nuclear transport factor 2 family protein (plasmid) [Klebsiella pneumoniae]|uniref:YybH family protein n=1 Tax=Enterobacterales TaxID=91347 RepID=UPI00094A027D|nr:MULTISPECIES: nuclear transport factor 2 family protein [Enterobacterales]HDT6511386.1 nuclear transport factor 2 family protein [Klebsiella aerogenes]EIW8484047.1 nuclear transport factor 2 family protein [Klebsiella pneumoniae]MBA2155573.1 nuclear transport factor 2 family protein [Enterobacter roggenkampii]MCB8428031.1 nuclear transport factor 2 family protein [Klebsiella pneumoniae]MCB8465174.1 nuclear transport factor 2 family protein [Klebsiella pneumoniae]